MVMRGVVSLLISLAVTSFEQTTAPSPRFETASVKPSDPSVRGRFTGGPGTDSPGQLTIVNYPLAGIIRRAFNKQHPWEYVMPFPVPAGNYDIIAKIPAGATSEQLNLMLQNLLAERFGLVVHKEVREIPTYELAAAKDGPKLAPLARLPAQPQNAPASGVSVWLNSLPKDKDGWPILPPETVGTFATTHAPDTREMYRGQPISQLVERLERMLPRPVLDKTGLTGIYSFDLTYPSISAAMASPALAAPAGLQDAAGGSATATQAEIRARNDAAFDDFTAGVLAAMERQLGLKLISAKGPVEILIIGHVNRKPTEN
jgi:uncharacterized protein (TIGR03435 family)